MFLWFTFLPIEALPPGEIEMEQDNGASAQEPTGLSPTVEPLTGLAGSATSIPSAFDARAYAQSLKASMRCNCDLDNWEPERSTGHSWVCRIHKATIAAERERKA
jgi:hypothetical protein